MVTKLVDSVYKPEWVAFANKCVEALANNEDVDARIAALKPASMPTPEFLERGCALRSRYMRFVFSELADADVVRAPALVSSIKSMCEAVRAIEQKVAAVDAAASNDARAGMWERFLSAADAQGMEAIADDVASKIRPLESAQIVPVSAEASPAQAAQAKPSPAPSLPSATPAVEARPPTKLDQLYSYQVKFGRGLCFCSCFDFVLSNCRFVHLCAWSIYMNRVIGQVEVESHLSLLWLDAVAHNIGGYIMKEFAVFMHSPSAQSLVLKHGVTNPSVHCANPNVFEDLRIPAFGKVSFTETRDSIKIAKIGHVQFYLNVPKTPWFEDKFNPYSAIRLQTASKKDKPTMFLSSVKTVLDFDDNGEIITHESAASAGDDPQADVGAADGAAAGAADGAAGVAADAAEVAEQDAADAAEVQEPEAKKRKKKKEDPKAKATPAVKAKSKAKATPKAKAAPDDRTKVTVELDLPYLEAIIDQKFLFFTQVDELLKLTVPAVPAAPARELKVCNASSKALWDGVTTPKAPKAVKDKALKDLKHLFA